MTMPAPMYSWTPARRSARTGAASTKVKTIAIATGSSSGRACSSRSTTATNSRPRPSHEMRRRGPGRSGADPRLTVDDGMRGRVAPAPPDAGARCRCPDAASGRAASPSDRGHGFDPQGHPPSTPPPSSLGRVARLRRGPPSSRARLRRRHAAWTRRQPRRHLLRRSDGARGPRHVRRRGAAPRLHDRRRPPHASQRGGAGLCRSRGPLPFRLDAPTCCPTTLAPAIDAMMTRGAEVMKRALETPAGAARRQTGVGEDPPG